MKEKKVKQSRHGLKIEKDLSVVKTAGFRAGKKRDKSVNRRAGLHDKSKSLRGERRVYKSKPLGIVRVRRIKQTIATLSAGLVGVAAYFGMGFLFKPDFVFVEELGNSTVCAAKSAENKAGLYSASGNEYYMPEDGSLPTDHTVIENIAYMNYVLKNQPSWSSYMESTVKTVMEQKVYTHKKYYDGKLISADMPQGASNIARQFCVTDKDVSWREKSKNYIYDDMGNIDWPSEKPTGLTVGEFRIYRGLPANEFSVYILNELTVKNFNDTSVEEKGEDENGKKLYTMKLDLRVHQSGLDSAVHYYKQQMYVTGGLYAWPSFDYTTVEYTFTEDWVVKEFTINDKYAAKMGSVSADCSSTSTTVFDYAEEKAVNSYYPDYFNQTYIKWDPTSSANEPTAASCLASAFGDVLTQGATLKLELAVDGKQIDGAVHLGMDGGSFNDLRVALDGAGAGVGGIKLYMADENGKKTLYFAIGGNKYKLGLDAFTAENGAAGASSATVTDAAGNGADGESGAALFDADALVEQLFGGKFTLSDKGKKATLESEIELFGLKIPVNFSFNIKKNVASLNEVTAAFRLGKNDIAARMTFGTEEDIPARLTEADKAQYTSLTEGITLGVKLGFGDISLNSNAFIGFANGGIGEVRAKFGGLVICYAPADNALYISHGNNVKYRLDLSSLGGSVDFDGILSGLDLNSVIRDALSNFYIGGGSVSTTVKVDLQQQLQQIISLAVSLEFNNGINVNVNGELFGKPLTLSVGLAHESVPEIGDKSEYTDILNGGISADVALTVDGLRLNGTLYLEMQNGAVASVRVALNNGAVRIYYEKDINGGADGDVIYIDLGASKIKLPVSALTNGNGGADLGGLLDKIDLKGLLAQAIEGLCGGENKFGCSFTLEIDGEKVPVSLGLDLNERLALRVEASVFGKGVTADIALGGGKAPELTDKDEYVDVINGGFAISGNVLISVNGKTAQLALNSLALRLNGGFGFELDARITAADKYFDIYASYLDNTLTLVYGSDDENESNFVGVRVNTKEDLALLKAALEDVYNRLCIVIGEVSPENADALSKENIKDLIDKVGAGSASADIMSEIFKILGIELGEGEQPNAEAVLKKLGIPLNADGSVDIKGLLKAVSIQSFGNGAAITLGENISVNIGIDAGAVNGGLAVQLGNASASVELTGIKLGAFAPECPVSANKLLTARDLADGLDYIAAAFELVAEREVALDADVTVTENGAEAIEVGVLVEYNQGENGFPVHIDSGKTNEQTGLREGVNLWVDPTAYLHFKLDLKNKRTEGKDLYVDAYILDATPVDKAYVTGGKYTADGMLDVYLSVSNGGGNPLTVYLPMKDILTVAAMGGALLNISDIELEGENLQELNKAVKQIAAVIDQLLVENYLGGLSSQFHSLGESVIGQILAAQNIQAKNLSELLNLLLKSVFGADAVEGNNVPAVSVAACGNYIKRVGFERGETERALAVVLNSAAVYGNGYSDIELRVTKNSYSYGIMPAVEGEEPVTQTVNKSYITGLSLSNVYFGENNAKKLDLRASLAYAAEKPASLAGYHSFADISALLAAVVNSATHEIAEVDGGADNNGGAAVTAADIAKKYALNSNYYIDGNVKIEVSGLGWLGLNANISINNFYVTINEDNSVEFNLSIYHDSFVGVITEKATVDITIKDDLILMRKTADGGKTYVTRVMTLTDFYADIMNQLKFIFAFSDSIMNAMTGSSGGSALVMKDFGDYLDGYLAGYAYSENNGAAVWSVDVSRKAINSLAGMEVFSQDIGVKLNADIQPNGQYKLNSLNIGSKLFGMLKFTANLNYRNPQNIWEGGNDLSGNVVKLDSKAQYGVDGRSWTTVLGGTKTDELAQSVNWGRLCRDTSGKTYIEYNGSNLHYGTLKFAYATDISNTAFEEFGERQRVLYGKNIYSVVDMPEISGVMPSVPDGNDRLVGYWDYGYITTDETDEFGAVIAMQAKYGAVTVSIISSQIVEGGLNGFTDYYQSEELGYVYYKTFKYDADNTVALAPQNNLNTYIFKGYYDYYSGERVEGFVADRPITLYAEWVGKTINITYSSDIAVDGAEADANGVYSLEGALQYGEGGSLHTPATTVEGVAFMGWYIEAGEGYAYIADAEALKQYCANAGIAGDSVDVRLWAVWVTETAVEVTNFTRSNSFVCWTWKVGFNYNGAEFCEGKSAEISGKLGASVSAKAVLELLDGDKSKITALNSGKEVQLSGKSYSDSYTSLKTDGSGDAAFIGVRVSVVVSCGEGTLTLTETGYKAK